MRFLPPKCESWVNSLRQIVSSLHSSRLGVISGSLRPRAGRRNQTAGATAVPQLPATLVTFPALPPASRRLYGGAVARPLRSPASPAVKSVSPSFPAVGVSNTAATGGINPPARVCDGRGSPRDVVCILTCVPSVKKAFTVVPRTTHACPPFNCPTLTSHVSGRAADRPLDGCCHTPTAKGVYQPIGQGIPCWDILF